MNVCLADTIDALNELRRRARREHEMCMARSRHALGMSLAALHRWPGAPVSRPVPVRRPVAVIARPMTDPQWIVCCATELSCMAPGLATGEAWRLASGACGFARSRVPEHVAAALALGLAAAVLH